MTTQAILRALPFALVAVVGLHLAAATLAGADREIVEFRLVKAKTVHLKDAKSAKELSQTLKSIGCHCTHDAHGDHHDVKYHCPKWKTIELKSHAVAHRWQDWLKKIGFETRHEH